MGTAPPLLGQAEDLLSLVQLHTRNAYALTTLASAGIEHLASFGSAHTLSETVLIPSLSVRRLECTLAHDSFFFK